MTLYMLSYIYSLIPSRNKTDYSKSNDQETQSHYSLAISSRKIIKIFRRNLTPPTNLLAFFHFIALSRWNNNTSFYRNL